MNEIFKSIDEFFGAENVAIKAALYAAAGYVALQVLSEWGKHYFGPARQFAPVSQPVNYQQGGFEQRADARYPLESGIRGTWATLRVMAALVRRDHADPVIRLLAEQIVSGCRGHEFDCEITACYEWVRDRITYRRDPVGVERVQDARRCLSSTTGDCDDKSVLLACLLCSLGHKCRFGLLGNKPDNFSHVYVECLSPRGWIALDPTPEKYQPGERGRALYYGKYPIFGR